MANRATIFVIGSIPHIVVAVFDRPLAACDIQHPLCVLFHIVYRGQACNPQYGFIALLAAGEGRELAANAYDLFDATKSDFIRTNRQCPDLPLFEPSVFFLNLSGLRRMCRGEKRGSVTARPPPLRWVDCL